jgi:acetyltransferase
MCCHDLAQGRVRIALPTDAIHRFGAGRCSKATSSIVKSRKAYGAMMDSCERDVTLRDGRAVRIRALQPSDEAEILQAFDRMSAHARYMRFMRVVKEPNLPRLRATLASFPERGLGLVATVPAADGYDIIGSAVAIVESDPTTCEFAINVADRFAGAGLASTLMRTLIDAAARRGLRVMEGFVLSENEPMLRLARGLGFSILRDPDDPSVQICRLELSGV